MTDQTEKSAEPDVTTRLAFDRTRVAYDRTLMAWIRTATSLITFGFTIYKFFQIEMRGGQQDQRLIGPREFAISMVGAGLISLLLGTLEYRSNMQMLRKQCPALPRSRIFMLAALISTLGILALIAVILRQ
jgi:putative membrane protein